MLFNFGTRVIFPKEVIPMPTLTAENNLEMSVDQVSAILGVSERTILNYIKAQQIKATKVGKRWFVDRKSFEDFQKNKGNTFIPINNIMKPDRTETTQATPEETISKYTSGKGKGKDNKNVKSLACYRLALNAFKMPMWQEDNPYSKYLVEFRTQILGSLGAGYYAFGSVKRYHYDQARSTIGSALALMYSDDAVATLYEKDLSFLENDVLLAFTYLLKKLEQLNRKNFSPRENNDKY